MGKLTDLTEELLEDHILDDDDVEKIMACAREQASEQPLTVKEIERIISIASGMTRKLRFSQVPLPLRILGAILFIIGILDVSLFIVLARALYLGDFWIGELNATTTTISLIVIIIVCVAGTSLLSLIVGIKLLRGRRGSAGTALLIMVTMDVVSLVSSIMVFGMGSALLFRLGVIIAKICLIEYLNPSIRRISKLSSALRSLDTETHAKRGTLGLADPGEGFIRLDFFNLFWTFVVCCFFGLIVEEIWHITVVDPGVWQDRAGLLYGPFSPIYGIGAVLMTIALNRFKDGNVILIFICCTLIGGAFEYFVSWFMEVGFGAVAWDYSNQPFNVGGRTCLAFASMFGVLGVAWIKAFLPLLLKIINKIPWQLRYSVTTICAALMLVNGIMTLQALDNWYARLSGHTPDDPIEQFYADNYPNDVMQNRFQSMDITPEKAARNN